MSTPELQAEAVLTLHLPQNVANDMERTAREEGTDVSALLASSYRSYKLKRVRHMLATVRPEQDVTEELQDVVNSWIKEVRTEASRADCH